MNDPGYLSGVDAPNPSCPTHLSRTFRGDVHVPSRTSTVEQVQPKVRALTIRIRPVFEYDTGCILPTHSCTFTAGCPFVDFYCGASMVKSSCAILDSFSLCVRHWPCIPHLFLSFPGQDVLRGLPLWTQTRSKVLVDHRSERGTDRVLPTPPPHPKSQSLATHRDVASNPVQTPSSKSSKSVLLHLVMLPNPSPHSTGIGAMP